MAKARNIYGVGNTATLPRSRMGRQRLVALLGPATGMPLDAAGTCPPCPPCQGMPAPPQATQAPAPVPAGVQLSAEVPYYTLMPKSALIAANYAGQQVTIDAVDGAGQHVSLATTSAPREDNVIEAWDMGRGFATNVKLVNLS